MAFNSVCSFCRIRPFVGNESSAVPEGSIVPRGIVVRDRSGVTVLDPLNKFRPKKGGLIPIPASTLHWEFVEDPKSPPKNLSNQELLYQQAIAPLFPHFTDGYSGTILVFGGANSGKTYTLFGDDSHTEEGRGIFQRFADDIFRAFEGAKRDNSSLKFELEVIDIAADTYMDLLVKRGQSREELKIREDKVEGTVLTGAIRKEIDSGGFLEVEVKNAVKGCKRRKSSVVVTLRITETYNFDDPNQPGSSISKSRRVSISFVLLRNPGPNFLRCIDHAYERDTTSDSRAKITIPVRDSPIARLVPDVFHGTAMGVAICCASPFFGHVKETMTTLQLSTRLSAIKTSPVHRHDTAMMELRTLADEVKELKLEHRKQNEAQNVVQKELDKRHKELVRQQKIYMEQEVALANAQQKLQEHQSIQQACKVILLKLKMARMAEIRKLEGEINDLSAETDQAKKMEAKHISDIEAAKLRIDKLQAEIAAEKENEAPVDEELGRWENIEAEVAELEKCCQAQPAEQRAKLAALDKELKEVQAKNKAALDEKKRKEEQLKLAKEEQERHRPAYELRNLQETKLRIAQDKVALQKQEMAELEKEIQQLEAQASAKQPKKESNKETSTGCCSIA